MSETVKYDINYENGIVNRGNLERMQKVMCRAAAGESLTIGFLGGSITQGSLASKPENCYAYRVFRWWCDTFPRAEFTYVNAGIGATNSQFACARAEQDLLCKNPDFVVIDFSVNDDCTEHFMETYEGVVRKVYAWESKPAVLLLHNVYYDTGANAQLVHGRVGRYYEIPAVSMQSSLYPQVLSGRIENREITPDDLHPNDPGHAIVASVITYFLEQVRRETAECENLQETQPDKTAKHEEEMKQLKKPLTANRYEKSVRYQRGCGAVSCKGFAEDTSPQNGITDVFKNGWTAKEVGNSIAFVVTGTCIGVQYRKTVKHPAPVAEVIVDGDAKNAKRLDANFDEDWGDKLVLDTVAEDLYNGVHTVEIRIIETHTEDVLPFYLVSVIGSVPDK